MKKIPFLFLLFICCGQNKETNLTVLCKLPKKLKEASGIHYNTNSTTLSVIEDSGNGSLIYEIGLDGKEIAKKVVTIDNIDWEDLASDQKGNLYIGDFGNNNNKRKDLCLYKINFSSTKDETITPDYKVSFYYPEQTEFPPSKKKLLYDCEAFFELKGFFYLFTKNRSKDFDGTTLIYKVPNTAGNHKAQLLGNYNTGDDYHTSAITGAAISPDGSKFVLLSHTKVWLFEDFKGDDFLNGTITELDLHHYSQKEAVCFKDSTTLLIADEKTKQLGGKVYEVSLRSLKSKP